MTPKEREVMTRALNALEIYRDFIADAHIIEGNWHWIDGATCVITALEEVLIEDFSNISPLLPNQENNHD